MEIDSVDTSSYWSGSCFSTRREAFIRLIHWLFYQPNKVHAPKSAETPDRPILELWRHSLVDLGIYPTPRHLCPSHGGIINPCLARCHEGCPGEPEPAVDEVPAAPPSSHYSEFVQLVKSTTSVEKLAELIGKCLQSLCSCSRGSLLSLPNALLAIKVCAHNDNSIGHTPSHSLQCQWRLLLKLLSALMIVRRQHWTCLKRHRCGYALYKMDLPFFAPRMGVCLRYTYLGGFNSHELTGPTLAHFAKH